MNRKGEKWSKFEEDEIIRHFKSGKTYEEISAITKRSSTALSLRFQKIAVEMQNSGLSLEEIMQATGVHLRSMKSCVVLPPPEPEDSEKKILAAILQELRALRNDLKEKNMTWQPVQQYRSY